MKASGSLPFFQCAMAASGHSGVHVCTTWNRVCENTVSRLCGLISLFKRVLTHPVFCVTFRYIHGVLRICSKHYKNPCMPPPKFSIQIHNCIPIIHSNTTYTLHKFFKKNTTCRNRPPSKLKSHGNKTTSTGGKHTVHTSVSGFHLLNAGKRPQGLAFSSHGEHGAALFSPLDRASPAGALQTCSERSLHT